MTSAELGALQEQMGAAHAAARAASEIAVGIMRRLIAAEHRLEQRATPPPAKPPTLDAAKKAAERPRATAVKHAATERQRRKPKPKPVVELRFGPNTSRLDWDLPARAPLPEPDIDAVPRRATPRSHDGGRR